MAMFAAEQLVYGMHPDEKWVRVNLGDAPCQVTEWAIRLVAERPLQYDGSLDPKVSGFTVDDDIIGQLRLTPESGYQ